MNNQNFIKRAKARKKRKNKLNWANENIHFEENEEFGLITVIHPENNQSKELTAKEAFKKMDNNQGGY